MSKINEISKKIICLLIVLVAVLCSCATNNYRDFYTSLEQPDETWVRNGQNEPDLIEVEDMSILPLWEAKGFCVLGISAFNGLWQNRAGAIQLAREIGASHVLFSSAFTERKEQERLKFIPIVNSTYHTGYVHTPYGGGNYSGISTNVSSTPVVVKETLDFWNQNAVYLAPLAKIPSFGVAFDSVPNVPGAVDGPVRIRVVYDGTPAQRQGLKTGDVVVKVNGVDIPDHRALLVVLGASPEIVSVEVNDEQ
ncbi:MAG: PDZ domain-containing protein [Lentisphaeria bacterium]|nr:PDZ domain-containing protein [Lentisphaeria bacterium]